MIDFTHATTCRPPSHAADRSLHWIAKPGQEPAVAEWVSGAWVLLCGVNWDTPFIRPTEGWRYLGLASPAPLQ